ncbi:MAG: DUF302 domain-containing protein [Nocardioides sp.]
MTYTITTTLARPYDEAVPAVREALGEQGFGILTEIDLQATLKAKIDADIAPYVILGACRPPLAYEAVQADPSIGALLPCNVVVRAQDDDTTIVEAVDPDAMMSMADSGALDEVAADAKKRLVAALDSLSD